MIMLMSKIGSDSLNATKTASLKINVASLEFTLIPPQSYYLKLVTNDLTNKFQPSAKINIKILNGNEIIAGGNIIIPKDIRMLDTTISIIRNGTNKQKPIINARLSSLIMNAGTTTSKPISSTFSGRFDFEMFKNNAISSFLVCFNIKLLSGIVAALIACSCVSSPFLYGLYACVSICLMTGDMINTVNIKESPTITWLGGTCVVPMAFFKKENTIVILVKLVIIKTIIGNNDMRVVKSKISSTLVFLPFIFMETAGSALVVNVPSRNTAIVNPDNLA